MAQARILALLTILSALLMFGCSQPDPGWIMKTPADSTGAVVSGQDTSVVAEDSVSAVEPRPDLDEALDESESIYATGVNYFHANQLDSAQTAYEQALAVLAELDLDPEQYPDQASRMERLLNEVEEDYRLTLIAAGTLSSEASVMAFRELFSDLKNFKKLKESPQVREFNTADTVIYDVDIEWNEKVENSLIYLQTVARDKFTDYLGRSAAYLPIMEAIFKERGLPHDLVYLPLIESGFKATAYSYARAAGFWQFISSTGRLYGLDHNWWYDERRDFVKSTDAAARHLKDLYDLFGSWNLALAAYNGGSGRVNREIRRAKSNNFWKLNLHKQTKAYVPLFMAATIIAKQPQKYGFYPQYADPLEYDTVPVRKCISLSNVSELTGISIPELERLNPELLRGVTPPDISEYGMRIPKGMAEAFAAVYEKIPTEKASSWTRHRVRRGETLSSIARKYGVSLGAVLDANKIGRSKRIYAGQTLTIPVPALKSAAKSKPATLAAKPSRRIVKESPDKYLVREGDTLWEIAEAYGVSIGEIKRLNGISSNSLYAGHWLRIPVSGQTDSIKDPITFNTHRVRRGDNLTRIASKYGTSVDAIKSANSMRSSTIYPGMSLKIPAKTSTNAQYDGQNMKISNSLSQKIYTVKTGDTLWRIARAHGVGISELARWNNLTVRSKLYPGDKLKIYYN